MGQFAVGLLYGCEAPELPATDDYDEPLYDLICRWEKAEGITWESIRGKPKIRHEHEGGKELLGVWVAVGGSGEDGAPYFLEECVPLDSLAASFRKRIGEASRLWKRFAAYVREKEKMRLPKPKLWLTPCETA